LRDAHDGCTRQGVSTGSRRLTFANLAHARVRSLTTESLPGDEPLRVGNGLAPLADLLRQLDDDSFRAADVAEPVAVLVALQLADELSAAGLQTGDEGVDVLANATWRIPRVFAGASRLSPSFAGEWNFTSSRPPLPSGVFIIAKSTRTPSSPTTRSTQRPACKKPVARPQSGVEQGTTEEWLLPTGFWRQYARASL
jgi:hypothetical protein